MYIQLYLDLTNNVYSVIFGTIVKHVMGSLDGKYSNKLETLSVRTTYN
jgi:hypothetical protein